MALGVTMADIGSRIMQLVASRTHGVKRVVELSSFFRILYSLHRRH